jgi:hypothetical protein
MQVCRSAWNWVSPYAGFVPVVSDMPPAFPRASCTSHGAPPISFTPLPRTFSCPRCAGSRRASRGIVRCSSPRYASDGVSWSQRPLETLLVLESCLTSAIQNCRCHDKDGKRDDDGLRRVSELVASWSGSPLGVLHWD